jgi:hypothetical protein
VLRIERASAAEDRRAQDLRLVAAGHVDHRSQSEQRPGQNAYGRDGGQ